MTGCGFFICKVAQAGRPATIWRMTDAKMTITTLFATIILTGALIGCSAFGQPTTPSTPTPTSSPVQAGESTAAPDDTGEETGNQTDTETEPTTEATPEPAPTTIPIPDDWEQTSVDALNLTLAHPPGWEVFVVEDRSKIDVRESGGDGWVEFGLVNEQTAPFWSIADWRVEPRAMLQSILAPASQDGTFQEPQNVSGDIWVARGRDTIYNEIVLYGIAPLSGEDTLLMVGHVTADIPESEQPTAAEEYFPIYQQMLTTVSQGE